MSYVVTSTPTDLTQLKKPNEPNKLYKLSTLMKFFFWFSLFMIFYAYAGYALVLLTIDVYHRFFKRRKYYFSSSKIDGHQADDQLPHVSFIITAYNEAARIAKKIENTLALSYPSEKFEIIVASDCSSDETDNIVESYAGRGVKLVRAPERKGKEHAQMHAVQAATGEIFVFSDVATILKPDALRNIVHNFQDSTIGCVSSEDRFIDRDGGVSGEGLYVRYEMFLRALESRVNTLVGMSGSFFAARREACQNWAPDLQSDFNTLLNAVKLGMKGISDPQSIGYYENIADERKEFQRKVRTVLRGIAVLMRNRQLLNPFRRGLFAWQLISHKICRWAVPFFLTLAMISNAFLLPSGRIYVVLFILQLFFYLAAAWYRLRWKAESYSHIRHRSVWYMTVARIGAIVYPVARIAYYFLSVNIAIAWAWVRFVKGERATSWEPSKR